MDYLFWLVVSTHLKNIFVNWDDDIPNSNGKISNVPVTTNQSSITIPLDPIKNHMKSSFSDGFSYGFQSPKGGEAMWQGSRKIDSDEAM